METLLEDYKRRLKTITNMINDLSHTEENVDTHKRLQTKKECYRTFISELEREITNVERK